MDKPQIIDVESCPFRAPTADPQIAVCRLLQRLSGGEVPLDARVARDACQACCLAETRSAGHINPVVASLLHVATGQCANDTTRTEPERATARMLHAYAAAHLPTVCRDVAGDGRFRDAQWSSNDRDRLDPYISQRRRSWWPVWRDWPQIGLVGWNTLTGLGIQNQGIAANLPICRWLVPVHPDHGCLQPLRHLRDRTWVLHDRKNGRQIRDWLAGLDWVLFVEHPLLPRLTELAKELGVRVACVCNWELTCPVASPW